MLVITRRRDEAIVVSDGIEIKVLRIGRDAVSLGVTAPPEVPVHRREIYEVIKAANAAAAASPDELKDLVTRLVPPQTGPGSS